MKTNFKTVITVVALTMALTGAKAQTKLSEGSVVYSITLTDNDIDPQVASFMPKEMTMYFKGDKSKTEMKMGMGQMAYIYDAKAKVMTTLTDMMGQKYCIKMTEEEMEKEGGKEKKTTIKYLDDTKVICGYTCYKAEVTTEGEKDKQTIYYTKDIVVKGADVMKGAMKGLEGFPVEYALNQNGIGMKMTAKTITKDKIDETIFKVPEGYKEMTKEEAMKMMGGGH